jgi:hypothetical protein
MLAFGARAVMARDRGSRCFFVKAGGNFSETIAAATLALWEELKS